MEALLSRDTYLRHQLFNPVSKTLRSKKLKKTLSGDIFAQYDKHSNDKLQICKILLCAEEKDENVVTLI